MSEQVPPLPAPKSRTQVRHEWNKRAAYLIGRKIVEARYMTEQEAEDSGWSCCPLVLWLDDDTQIIPMADDEGNDGGSLDVTKGAKRVGFPVL